MSTESNIQEAELLTQAELAKRLRVTKRTIQTDKKMPRIQWRRTVRYSWIEVLAYLKSA